MVQTDQIILEHYKRVAKNFGVSPLSTMRDQFIRNCEVDFILGQIMDIYTDGHCVDRILDIGCGNGFLLSKIRELLDHPDLFGLEFTPELHEVCLKRNLERCEFHHGDVRNPIKQMEPLDVIITERSLINILSWPQQYQALQNIYSALKSGGHFIMVESFREPFENLNQARREMGLENLEVSYQNRYFNHALPKYMQKIGFHECETHLDKNYLSTHFYLTRVLHPVIRPDKGRLRDNMFVYFFSHVLEPAVGEFSPILFHMYQKK